MCRQFPSPLSWPRSRAPFVREHAATCSIVPQYGPGGARCNGTPAQVILVSLFTGRRPCPRACDGKVPGPWRDIGLGCGKNGEVCGFTALHLTETGAPPSRPDERSPVA